MRYEIQARSPHGTHAYCVDNSAVFDMLNAAIDEHKNVKTWIKRGESLAKTLKCISLN
jgi:hypothetical protein